MRPRKAHCVRIGTRKFNGFDSWTRRSTSRGMNLPNEFQNPYTRTIAPRMFAGDHSDM
jgi:hypothetical protein